MSLKRITVSFALLVVVVVPAHAGSWTSGKVKNPSGSLEYKLFVSSAYRKEKSVPLVVMLHGCTQKVEELAAISGINELADKNNFLVAYPEQSVAANPLKCWNWFDPKHQSRDAGEPSLIAAVIQDIRTSYNIDEKRMYVVGISAGGAMAVVMGTAYPELFAGLGVIAGTEYKAALNVQDGLTAMKQGGPDPNQQGLLAFQAIQKSPVGTKTRLPLIVFQGTKDPYLSPVNTDQLITQWAQTHDYLDDGKDNDSVSIRSAKEKKVDVPGGYSLTKSSYSDSQGHLLLEKWIVEGLGHAWPGSSVANPFADAKGPNATEEMWRFFSETTSGTKPKAGNE
jgi:poly(hydroxyalkanoate) depolymerase family esterase